METHLHESQNILRKNVTKKQNNMVTRFDKDNGLCTFI